MQGSDASRSYRFPRAHRLKEQRLIRPLFDRRRTDVKTVAVGCVRLLYRMVRSDEMRQHVPLQIGFAPGRTATAVQRNSIKRSMREVYRVHQHILIDLLLHKEEVLTVMALFRGRPEQAQACLPRDLPEALRRVAARIEAAGPSP